MDRLRRWHSGLLLALGIISIVIGECSIADVEIDHRLRIVLAIVQIAAGLGVIYTTIRIFSKGKEEEK